MITYKKNISVRTLFKSHGKYDLNDFLNHKNRVYCSSVRTGLIDVLKSLNISDNEYVLLPPICPQGLILPLQKCKINYKFYHLKDDFKVDIQQLQSEIKSGNYRIVFFIHYFGLFNSQVLEVKSICKDNNSLLFEDVVHGFLGKDPFGNEPGSVGDVSFCSLSKFFPVPDGAVFFINDEKLKIKFQFKKSVLHSLSVFFNVLSLILYHTYLKCKNKFIRKPVKLVSLFFYYCYYSLLCTASANSGMAKISKQILSNIDFNSFIFNRKELFSFYNSHFNLYNDDYIPVSPGYPIINPDFDFRKTREKLNSLEVEALMYVKAWNYIPDEKSFDYERKLIHGHILLPLDVDSIDLYTESKLIAVKEILNEAFLPVSQIKL